MTLLYVKAVHIVFVVTWFSGLFYLARLFVNVREVQDRPEPERGILTAQLLLMSKRLLFGITLPSALVTLLMGAWLLYLYPGVPGWLQVKIGLVALLYGYHYSLHRIYGQQRRGLYRYSGMQLRLWNEVPSVFLVAIVMLVVVKQNLSAVYGLLGLAGLVVALLVGIRVYKALRARP